MATIYLLMILQFGLGFSWSHRGSVRGTAGGQASSRHLAHMPGGQQDGKDGWDGGLSSVSTCLTPSRRLPYMIATGQQEPRRKSWGLGSEVKGASLLDSTGQSRSYDQPRCGAGR